MTCRLIIIREDHAPVFSDFDSERLAKIAARPLHAAGHKVCGVDLSWGRMTDFSERFKADDRRAEAVARRESEEAYARHVDSLSEEEIVQMGANHKREYLRYKDARFSRHTVYPEPLHWRVEQRLKAIKEREAEEQKWTDAMGRLLFPPEYPTLHIDLSPGAINARVVDNTASAPDMRGLQASDADTPFRLFLVWAGGMALVCLGILVLT